MIEVELDRDRVEALSHEVARAVVANFRAGPPSPCRALEALNALASCVALVLAGTDADPAERGFFNEAVEQPMTALRGFLQ